MPKILVADSANITHFMMVRILDQRGHQIYYVKYPRDLISQSKEIMPDVIFLEPEISGGKGKQIVEYLAKQPETRHIPIILITRITETSKYKMDEWPGVYAVLRKPLKSEGVITALEKVPIARVQDFDKLSRQLDVG